VSNIQSSCHLSISGHDTKADHKPKNEPAGFSPSLDGLYCWESNIYAASTDLRRKEEKLYIFFLPSQSSSKSPFIFVILHPFDGLYRSTEKLSVRSIKPEGPTVALSELSV
jgi:hypothetical protein